MRMAQTKPQSSLATAVMAKWRCLRLSSRRNLLSSRCWAFSAVRPHVFVAPGGVL